MIALPTATPGRQMKTRKLRIPRKKGEPIPVWIERVVTHHYKAKYVDGVVTEFLDHLTGNREGNRFIREAAIRWFGLPVEVDRHR